MIDSMFRDAIENRVGLLLSLYKRLGLTPNHISLGALVFALFAAGLTASGCGIVAAGVWWLGRVFDGTDGIYARATNQTSDFGAYLDIVCDMAAYSVMILGFYVLHPHMSAAWLAISILYTLCITSALAMGNVERAQNMKQTDRRGLRLGAGLAEAGETGIAYTLFLLMPQWIEALVALWLFILIITVVSRTLLVQNLTSE